jgi:hypothetical protein
MPDILANQISNWAVEANDNRNMEGGWTRRLVRL